MQIAIHLWLFRQVAPKTGQESQVGTQVRWKNCSRSVWNKNGDMTCLRATSASTFQKLPDSLSHTCCLGGFPNTSCWHHQRTRIFFLGSICHKISQTFYIALNWVKQALLQVTIKVYSRFIYFYFLPHDIPLFDNTNRTYVTESRSVRPLQLRIYC